MPWHLARKAEPEARVEYVPVPSYGRHADLWENPAYLSEVKNLAETRAWVSEVTELVRLMREVADNADTPDRLKGANLCIALAKQMLVLKPMAVNQIQGLMAREEAEKAARAGV